MINPIKKFSKKHKPGHTFHPEYDDEFYINEVIGIEEITYEDFIENRKEKNDKK